jgi:hypothetical protein
MTTEPPNPTFTVRELRAAIDELAADAPDLTALAARLNDDARDRSPRRSTTRRWKTLAAPVAAALIVVSVVVAVVALTHSGNGHRSARPGPGHGLTCGPAGTAGSFDTFSVNRLPGLDTSSWLPTVCPGLRKMSYTTLGDRITLYDRGVFPSALLRGAPKVRGFGITGYSVTLPADPTLCGLAQPRPTARIAVPLKPTTTPPGTNTSAEPASSDSAAASCSLPALAWRYAPDAWGVVMRSPGAPVPPGSKSRSRPSALQIAAAVDPTPKRLPVAVRVGHLPADYAVGEVESSPPDNTGYDMESHINAGPSGVPTDCSVTSCSAAGLIIDVSTSIDKQFSTGWKGTSIEVNGMHGVAVDLKNAPQGNMTADYSAMLVFGGSHWYVIMSASAASRLSTSDLLAVAKGLTFAARPTDTASWFSADRDLPH